MCCVLTRLVWLQSEGCARGTGGEKLKWNILEVVLSGGGASGGWAVRIELRAAGASGAVEEVKLTALGGGFPMGTRLEEGDSVTHQVPAGAVEWWCHSQRQETQEEAWIRRPL